MRVGKSYKQFGRQLMTISVFTSCEIKSILRSKDVNLVKMMGTTFSDRRDNLK